MERSILSIYIGNLPYAASQEDIKEVFNDYGKVSKVTIPIDRESGKVRGFAFVEMEDEAQEEEAIKELDGAEWMGRELRVNKARPRENNRDRGGAKKDFRRNNSFDNRY